MLTGHQRLHLRRAGLRVEDDLGGTFVAILDHPVTADAHEFAPPPNGEKTRRDDIDSISLPFVAFRATRGQVAELPPSNSGLIWRIEWSVGVLATQPDADGIHFVPQLDRRGEEALAFLESFVGGLEPQI